MNRIKRLFSFRMFVALAGLGLLIASVPAFLGHRPIAGLAAVWAGCLLLFLVWHHGICRLNADLPPRDGG